MGISVALDSIASKSCRVDRRRRRISLHRYLCREDLDRDREERGGNDVSEFRRCPSAWDSSPDGITDG